ncbi:MAG: 2-amino-4-hydroxy-6-hydroxymethyldihydropteridine diphosphokinase [Candidatus Hydrogenedentes bacterium]|nr:2-amino-4-hydroxy-6-hydroxymethyldihydropteridine diphosphokinase [Candidatus Hydrogenedentota bacterium]
MLVHLSLGSNTGDREGFLLSALRSLNARNSVRVVSVSSVYETEPIGYQQQPDFLNLAAAVETELAPLELLDVIQDIESQLGRTPTERWGPRVIDIDIVLWGGLELESERLTIPHRSFRERAFVLEPLLEIAGDAIDPVTGMSIADLAARPTVQGWVRPYRPAPDAGSFV